MSKRSPSVEDVERSGTWVCARHNGARLPKHVLYYWLQSGCPYTRGRTLTAMRRRVQVTGFMSPKLVWFFRRAQLDKVGPLFHARKVDGIPHHKTDRAGRSRALKQKYAEYASVTVKGKEWVRPRSAWEMLGVSQPLLLIWATKYCPYKEGRACLRTMMRRVHGRLDRYYLLKDLLRVKRSMDELGPSPGEVTVDDAVRITGMSPLWFRLDDRAQELKLTKRVRLVKSAVGRAADVPVFDAGEIEALRQRALAVDNALTVDDVAATLKVSRKQAMQLIGDRYTLSDIPTQKRPKRGTILVTSATVEEIRKAIRDGAVAGGQSSPPLLCGGINPAGKNVGFDGLDLMATRGPTPAAVTDGGTHHRLDRLIEAVAGRQQTVTVPPLDMPAGPALDEVDLRILRELNKSPHVTVQPAEMSFGAGSPWRWAVTAWTR